MNIEMLQNEFKEILALEEKAEHLYDHFISRVDDEEIKKQLIAIYNDEKLHVKIAKTLIECVS